MEVIQPPWTQAYLIVRATASSASADLHSFDHLHRLTYCTFDLQPAKWQLPWSLRPIALLGSHSRS